MKYLFPSVLTQSTKSVVRTSKHSRSRARKFPTNRGRGGGVQPVLQSRFENLAHWTWPQFVWWFAGLAACACLTGCFGFLKPAPSTARHFVLTPLAPAEPMAGTLGSPAVGLGQVKVPPYLFDTSFAVRKGTNEISYLPSVLWAERLDNGLQRVLAANLSTLLATGQVRLSAWRSDDVSAELYVTIQQLDVDASGHGVLVAWWRILSPGGEKTLQTGERRLELQGPPPGNDPSGAVATLSRLVADFSRQLAQAVQKTWSEHTKPNR